MIHCKTGTPAEKTCFIFQDKVNAPSHCISRVLQVFKEIFPRISQGNFCLIFLELTAKPRQ